MSNEPTISQVARNDQMTTELNDTIGRVCIAYKMLTNAGIPEDHAAMMVGEFNRRLLNRHFGVQMIMMNEVFMDGGED
jgi:hypothetical protein